MTIFSFWQRAWNAINTQTPEKQADSVKETQAADSPGRDKILAHSNGTKDTQMQVVLAKHPEW